MYFLFKSSKKNCLLYEFDIFGKLTKETDINILDLTYGYQLTNEKKIGAYVKISLKFDFFELETRKQLSPWKLLNES